MTTFVTSTYLNVSKCKINHWDINSLMLEFGVCATPKRSPNASRLCANSKTIQWICNATSQQDISKSQQNAGGNDFVPQSIATSTESNFFVVFEIVLLIRHSNERHHRNPNEDLLLLVSKRIFLLHVKQACVKIQKGPFRPSSKVTENLPPPEFQENSQCAGHHSSERSLSLHYSRFIEQLWWMKHASVNHRDGGLSPLPPFFQIGSSDATENSTEGSIYT